MNRSTGTRVREFYQKFPYPHYPLLARPRIEQGYLTSPIFARRLLNTHFGKDEKTLCLGCGEILPVLLRAWLPRESELIAIDASSRSCRRARFRLLGHSKTQIICADLDEWLTTQSSESVGHVDAYGVLHHLADPRKTLQEISRVLSHGGTARVMIYNSMARDWIWQINRLLRSNRMLPTDRRSVRKAAHLVQSIAPYHSLLAERLKQSGHFDKISPTRFADTFMNPHELRRPAAWWWQAFEEARLKPFALFDRYAELDDLPNPLWQMPTLSQLTERCLDRRFENNFEIYLVKGDVSKRSLAPPPLSSIKKAPPQWFQYEETKHLQNPGQLLRSFLQELNGNRPANLNLPSDGEQRLSRLGAIHEFSKHRLRPMTDSMDAQNSPVEIGSYPHLGELTPLAQRRLSRLLTS